MEKVQCKILYTLPYKVIQWIFPKIKFDIYDFAFRTGVFLNPFTKFRGYELLPFIFLH